MKIDGAFGYDVQGASPKGRPPGQQAAKAVRGVEPGVEVTESARKYIDKALAAEEVDLAAVAEAKKLLADGLLDTPEAIDRVADAIVERGL